MQPYRRVRQSAVETRTSPQRPPLSPPWLRARADQKRSSARELEAAVRDAEQIVSAAAAAAAVGRPATACPRPPARLPDRPHSPPTPHPHHPTRNNLQLQCMDMEARSYSPEQARALLQKCKEYKADLAKLREDARRAGGAAAASADTRAELGLGGTGGAAGSDYFATSAGQRDRLLTATDRLGKTSDRIQQGRQQLLETEVGGGSCGWGCCFCCCCCCR